jgi:hypothetical protein
VEHVLRGANQHHGHEVSAGDGLVAELKQEIGCGREQGHETTPGELRTDEPKK